MNGFRIRAIDECPQHNERLIYEATVSPTDEIVDGVMLRLYVPSDSSHNPLDSANPLRIRIEVTKQ